MSLGTSANSKSMNGLTNIDADSINSSEIDCDILRTDIIYANTARGTFNFDQKLPESNIIPFNNTDLVNKLYTDQTFVTLNTNQNILNTKYFNQIPRTLTSCTLSDHITTKFYVDNAVSTAGGAYVTITGAQTITGNKDFTGTTRLGDALGADQPTKVSIMNNTSADSSIIGTIGGESVYHQFRMGSRSAYWSQGVTNNINQYYSISHSGSPDPNVVLTITDRGLKVADSNVNNQTTFTEALYCVGASRFTGNMRVQGSASIFNDLSSNGFCSIHNGAYSSGGLQLANNSYSSVGVQIASGPNFTGFVNIASGVNCNGNVYIGNSTGAGIIFVGSSTKTLSLNGVTTNITSTNLNISSIVSIGGTILNGNSTQNWFNGDYTNLNGAIQTTIRSPLTLITGTSCQYFTNEASIQTAFKSPSFLITNACTSFDVRATNTYLENSIVTATTQPLNDNSNKIATTAYVYNTNQNYMTISGPSQFIPSVKTYEKQQIFLGGLTSNNIYASGTTDMSIGSNMGNGILNIDQGRIICDTFGTRINGINLQLNSGTFIQPNPSLAIGESPAFSFPNNLTQNFTNFVGASGTGEATRRIDSLGIWCGNNQASTFFITHSLTNGYSIGPGAWQEEIITFSFVDSNTGITRYVSPNYATTTVFSMPSLGTVIRPSISFTLDSNTLPQGAYNVYVYVKIINAFINQALNIMTWNLSATPSTLTTTQNYNTYADYTFTNRTVYSIMRNFVAGVYIINNIATQQNIMTPLYYSITDFTNMMFQPTITGAVTTPAITGGTAAGSWVGLSVNNADNIYLVYPNYSIILYDAIGWTGSPILNFKNTGLNPVTVRPSTTQIGSSCRIYFDEVELIKY
jgi:hypothetical protein